MKALFIDGTKLEANANCYTFVWCGSINYHLGGLLDTIGSLYSRYNMLLCEKGYDKKYNLGTVQMFVVEGIERVREVIEKNRKRRKYTFCSWERKKATPNENLMLISTISFGLLLFLF